MEYILIIALQLIGIGLHAMQKVISLGEKFPSEGPKYILGVFFKEDWDTLLVSFFVLCLNLVVHYILSSLGITWGDEKTYQLTNYGLALLMGYAGQRLIYRYLGTAEKVLDKHISDKYGN